MPQSRNTQKTGAAHSRPADASDRPSSVRDEDLVETIQFLLDTRKTLLDLATQVDEALRVIRAADDAGALRPALQKIATATTPKPHTTPPSKTNKFTPTEEQIAVLRRAHDPVLKITALAGTGKTTTLKLYAQRRGRQKGLYVAFNKAIADEAKRSFPDRVECRTINSLAYRALGVHRHRNQLRSAVYPQQVARVVGLSGSLFGYARTSLLSAVLEAIWSFCQSADDEITAAHASLRNLEATQWVAERAQDLWCRMSNFEDASVPFTHDVYLKKWQLEQGGNNLPFDYLLVDEAQDLNPVTAAIIDRFPGDKVYVGDQWQQIYGFRGAINALKTINAPELYLTRSFRFGQAVADVANRILNFALERPKRPVLGNPEIESSVSTQGDVAAVICRTNAGVFEIACEAQHRLHILGGFEDAAELLLSAHALKTKAMDRVKHRAIRRFRSWQDLLDYLDELDDPELSMITKIVRKYGPDLPAMIEDVRSRIVDEDAADLTLTTLHRAKGREWAAVGLAHDFRHPEEIAAQRAQRPSPELEEEIYLLYVAATRARQFLRLPGELSDTLAP